MKGKAKTSILVLLTIVIAPNGVFSQSSAVKSSKTNTTTVATAVDDRTITGVVLDEKGETVIGASVLIKGTSTGTMTDLTGAFRIALPPSVKSSPVVQVSYVGYVQAETVFNGKSLRIVLKEDVQTLDDLVVTALGIKREEKGLGYATQSVDGGAITSAMTSNWSNALAGKVAGLSISTAGGVVSSTQINVRGAVSLNPEGNGALVVVDGVPLSNRITNGGNGGSAYGAGGTNESIDYGNSFADINPDDIENIQVLKGASASALYGTRAANGVVMITTKSGNRGKKGIGVTISTNTSMENVMRWPDYQYEFGQGLPSNIGAVGSPFAGDLYYSYGAGSYIKPDGSTGSMSSTSGTSSAYGAKFDPQRYFVQYNPTLQGRDTVATPWRAYENNRTGLFQTGYTTTNTVAIDGSHDKGSVRASITYAKNEWLLPNTGFDRISASLSGNQQISRNLNMSYKASYSNRKVINTPAMGYNSNSIAYFLIFQNPNVNLDWLRPQWRTGETQIKQLQPYSSFIGNPFVTLYESINPSDKHSVISNLSVTYAINRKMDLMVRSGVQLSHDERSSQRPVSDVVYAKGFYRQQGVFEFENNTDALFSYRETFSNGLKMNISVGGNMMIYHYNSLAASVTGLVTPGVYKLANGSASPFVVSNIQNKALNSLYGALTLGWRNKLFLDVTGRNDWSSTLPAQNRSFFYPSASVSAILNEFFTMPQYISLMKLRGSLAQVGNDTAPYKTGMYYNTSNFPGSAVAPSTLANADFKPEISTNYEAGLDLRLLKNRVGIDFTFYYNQTRNQIIDAPMDAATGYTRATINSGNVRNRGYELLINALPIQNRNFTWSSTLTWSRNENKILQLAEGMDENQLIGSIGSVSVIGKVGGSTGDLWGNKTVRNENGDRIIETTGLPARSTELVYVGNAYADWKAGWINTFSYKGVRLTVQLDGQFGGIVYSQAHHKMTEQGKLAHTLNGRLPGSEYYMAKDDPRIAAAGLAPLDGVYMIAPGVVKNEDGTFSPNTKVITVEAYYKERYRIGNVEENSFDASFLKLREVRLDYTLPKQLTDRTPFARLTLGVYGRNLAVLTAFPLFDPESSALNGGSIVPGVETGQLPTARSFGFSLSATF